MRYAIAQRRPLESKAVTSAGNASRAQALLLVRSFGGGCEKPARVARTANG